jgi:hypothetical protein
MNPRDIKLSGLTYEQVEMLDIMWSLDTVDEFFDWYETLDKDDQNTVDTLQRLIILEVADAQWENTKRFPQAKAVLKQFML